MKEIIVNWDILIRRRKLKIDFKKLASKINTLFEKWVNWEY